MSSEDFVITYRPDTSRSRQSLGGFVNMDLGSGGICPVRLPLGVEG